MFKLPVDVVIIKEKRGVRRISTVLFVGGKKGRILRGSGAATWVGAGKARIDNPKI